MAPFGQCVFGTAVTTLFHPIAYAKVLIQVRSISVCARVECRIGVKTVSYRSCGCRQLPEATMPTSVYAVKLTTSYTTNNFYFH